MQGLTEYFDIADIFSRLISFTAENSDKLQDIELNLSNIVDKGGISVTVIGYTVVFASLVFLYFAIYYLTRMMTASQRKKLRKAEHPAAEREDLTLSGEISAAIAMTLYKHFDEAHDLEDMVLTIEKTKRAYSPWSSKIYNITPVPNRKSRVR